MLKPATSRRSRPSNDMARSVVMACARILTERDNPWRWANSPEQTMAAAAPQVGGQAISRVITPGHIMGEAMTSSVVTVALKTARGFFAAWRLALALILAKVSSFVPKRLMCSMPAAPKIRNAMGTLETSALASTQALKCSNTDGRSLYMVPSAPGFICSNPKARTQSAIPLITACLARYSAVEPEEQLLLTLMTGIPVMPTSYKARWAEQESP